MKNENVINLEDFSKLLVQDGDGKQHTIAEFWKEKLAVLIYVRQFG